MLQAIIFDFDGVIADSERLHLRAYQEVLGPEGIELSERDYYDRYLGYDDVGVLRELGKDRGVPMNQVRIAELVERKGRRYDELASAGEMLYPGAAAFIGTAAARVPIAIASGALTVVLKPSRPSGPGKMSTSRRNHSMFGSPILLRSGSTPTTPHARAMRNTRSRWKV